MTIPDTVTLASAREAIQDEGDYCLLVSITGKLSKHYKKFIKITPMTEMETITTPSIKTKDSQ